MRILLFFSFFLTTTVSFNSKTSARKKQITPYRPTLKELAATKLAFWSQVDPVLTCRRKNPVQGCMHELTQFFQYEVFSKIDLPSLKNYIDQLIENNVLPSDLSLFILKTFV